MSTRKNRIMKFEVMDVACRKHAGERGYEEGVRGQSRLKTCRL